ncbi:MAG TPA: hypothetical protein VM867_03835 [Xanthobacteraceae bacterium]|nr:hypothetical protein [Xanthobacteraceae bacterium]
MMRSRLLFAAVLAAASFVATAGHAADVVFPPGSRIGLVPPQGFEVSTAGRGFGDPQNKSAIMILEMPPQAFPEVEKAMTADILKQQGVAVAFRETLNLKNGKALLIGGRQTVEGTALRKWIMVAETPNATALVTALVPDSSKNAYSDAVIRAALVSLDKRDAVPAEELLGLLPYKLTDTAGLRPIRVEGPTIFLTEGPKDAVEPSEQPLLVVAAAPGGPAELAQRDNFARTLFASTGSFKEVRIISTDIIRLNAMQTHQILAEGKDAKTGADIKIVQWVRFGNGAFLRFLGVANNDAWSEAFTKFRTVRDGVATK